MLIFIVKFCYSFVFIVHSHAISDFSCFEFNRQLILIVIGLASASQQLDQRPATSFLYFIWKADLLIYLPLLISFLIPSAQPHF